MRNLNSKSVRAPYGMSHAIRYANWLLPMDLSTCSVNSLILQLIALILVFLIPEPATWLPSVAFK